MAGDGDYSDEFMMNCFKIEGCPEGNDCHRISECPYTHSGDLRRRRDHRQHHYSSHQCLVFKNYGFCPFRDECRYAHGDSEASYHPQTYRTCLCTSVHNGVPCGRRFCSFAHNEQQLRRPSSDAPGMNQRQQGVLPGNFVVHGFPYNIFNGLIQQPVLFPHNFGHGSSSASPSMLYLPILPYYSYLHVVPHPPIMVFQPMYDYCYGYGSPSAAPNIYQNPSLLNYPVHGPNTTVHDSSSSADPTSDVHGPSSASAAPGMNQQQQRLYNTSVHGSTSADYTEQQTRFGNYSVSGSSPESAQNPCQPLQFEPSLYARQPIFPSDNNPQFLNAQLGSTVNVTVEPPFFNPDPLEPRNTIAPFRTDTSQASRLELENLNKKEQVKKPNNS